MKLIILILLCALRLSAQTEADALLMIRNLTTSSGLGLSNQVKFLVIPVTGDYTITPAEVEAMRTTNLFYRVDSNPSNINLTFPAAFPNTFTVYNAGTNWAVVTAASGNTFVTLPAAGGITYSTALNNKYAGKSQQFFMANATNYVVSSDFRPLPNIRDDVINYLKFLGDGNATATFTSTNGTNYVVIAVPLGSVLQSSTNYANGVTNASIVRQADLNAASNALVATFTRTNFISGQRYTNGAIRTILVMATIHLTNAAVSGVAQMDLVVGTARTNAAAVNSLSTSLAGWQRQQVSDLVNTNEVYYFTNTSTGAGDGATIVAGSGVIISP